MRGFLILLVVTLGVCGCNRQAKLNGQKMDDLNRRLDRLEQAQARQQAVLQTELNGLAPQLDRMNSTYFEKDRDAALFFHTNTLYLLLTIGKQIETQLQLADAERQTQNSLEYTYHTNQLGALYVCTAQLTQALMDEQRAAVASVNAETRQVAAASQAAVLQGVKQATAPDPAQAVWQKSMQADLERLERQMDVLNTRLTSTNPLPAAP